MTKEQIKAVVSMVALCAVNVAAQRGVALDADAITSVLLAVLTVTVTLWACWKNHNLTPAAEMAQRFLDGLKDEDGLLEEADEANCEEIADEDEDEQEAEDD